jgi:hypothetical protein
MTVSSRVYQIILSTAMVTLGPALERRQCQALRFVPRKLGSLTNRPDDGGSKDLLQCTVGWDHTRPSVRK